MKNILKMFTVLAAFVLIGAASAFAQGKTGGYKKVSAQDAAVKAAAAFAAQAQGGNDGAEIVVQSIETAERQTVAGANFRLCIEVSRVDEGEDVAVTQFVQTVVLQNLKRQYTLKSWEEVEDCGAPE